MYDVTKEVVLTTGERMDVSDIKNTRRLIYLKEEGKVIIKGTPYLAYIENDKLYAGRGEVLTPKTAAKIHPEVFCHKKVRSASEIPHSNGYRKYLMILPNDMYDFCYCKQSNMSDYIRSLIQREMDKEKESVTKP